MRHLVFATAFVLYYRGCRMRLGSYGLAAGPLGPAWPDPRTHRYPPTPSTRSRPLSRPRETFHPASVSYGIYFWLYERLRRIGSSCRLLPAPAHERGLGRNGAFIPWTTWGGGDFALTSSVCQVEQTWQNQKAA